MLDPTNVPQESVIDGLAALAAFASPGGVCIPHI